MIKVLGGQKQKRIRIESAILRKQKAERDQASSEYFNKLGDLYNKIANSDNSTILDKISHQLLLLINLFQIQHQDF